MARQKHIENTHKGEPVEILLEAKNGDGTVIDAPTEQTITMTVSKTPQGPALLTFDTTPQILLADETKGEWLIELKETDLAGLQENQPYHYNIWSERAGGYQPRLQAYGRLKRLRSIQYS